MADFEDTRETLFRKPKIRFVEPEQQSGQQQVEEEPQPDISEARQRTENLVNQYKRLEKLSNRAQKRIDNRAKNMEVHLDPDQDSHIIEAVKRQFGTEEPKITYEQYKQCLNGISKAGSNATPKISRQDMKNAASDPFSKNFGGFTESGGALRPELMVESPVKPINIQQFQSEQLIKLFQMLSPMLSQKIAIEVAKQVAQHLKENE